MKYIIFEDNKTGLIQPVIFGEHTTHSQVKIENATPVSAGFFYIDKRGFVVSGESESLGLKPKDGDEEFLKLVLYNAGTMFFINPDSFHSSTTKSKTHE